jgi:glycosyltransferase involved in cell wall biosynthesis
MDFSVIIPAKNEEDNIGRCLESIFANDYPAEKFEVFVIDNGSNDATEQIARGMGAEVFSFPGGKISSLRNFGAEKSRGKILAFIDADCTVDRKWLQEASRYLDRGDVVCFGSAPVIPTKHTWVQHTWFMVRQKSEVVMEVAWLESMNMFIPQEAFLKVKGFDENLITCEDVDISYRLSKLGQIISDQKIKAIHHGEAKNLREFFRKEKWRGKSNYHGLFRHGLKISELPSLVLPLYFVGVLLASLGTMISGAYLMAGVFFSAAQLPIFALTLLKTRHDFGLTGFCRLLILYNIYFLARASAVF